jgi:hypothetical protein
MGKDLLISLNASETLSKLNHPLASQIIESIQQHMNQSTPRLKYRKKEEADTNIKKQAINNIMETTESEDYYHTPLPTMPIEFAIFDKIHLNSTDNNMINCFYESISNESLSDDSNEGKLFHIICMDFGAEIFIQHSNIFKVIKL